ncbi:MAG: hypothetical protein ABFS38_19405 [Bacteroidota bacterium]
MGSIIHRVATAGDQLGRGYMHTGSKAIKRCVSVAGIDPNLVGMLINTGVYTDDYIQEPAFSALLQGKTKMGSSPGPGGMLSYDLHVGGGGMIMAFRILNGYLQSGRIESGLVVAGDTVPEDSKQEGHQCSEGAGAVLLVKGEPDMGFKRFKQDTYSQYSRDFNSYTNYIDGDLKTFINQSDKYLEHCIICVKESVSHFLLDEQLQVNDIDLIISSQSPVGFAVKIDQLYGESGIVVIEGERELYSAGIAFALESAMKSGQFSNAKRILFVSVGAGITVNLALYEG